MGPQVDAERSRDKRLMEKKQSSRMALDQSTVTAGGYAVMVRSTAIENTQPKTFFKYNFTYYFWLVLGRPCCAGFL